MLFSSRGSLPAWTHAAAYFVCVQVGMERLENCTHTSEQDESSASPRSATEVQNLRIFFPEGEQPYNGTLTQRVHGLGVPAELVRQTPTHEKTNNKTLAIGVELNFLMSRHTNTIRSVATQDQTNMKGYALLWCRAYANRECCFRRLS